MDVQIVLHTTNITTTGGKRETLLLIIARNLSRKLSMRGVGPSDGSAFGNYDEAAWRGKQNLQSQIFIVQMIDHKASRIDFELLYYINMCHLINNLNHQHNFYFLDLEMLYITYLIIFHSRILV